MAKIFKKKNDKDIIFDYRDFKTLQRFMNIYGRIETRKKTGLSARQQRNLATAVKRARHLALLPFVAK
jgi:small subunit ribosomal protein S18